MTIPKTGSTPKKRVPVAIKEVRILNVFKKRPVKNVQLNLLTVPQNNLVRSDSESSAASTNHAYSGFICLPLLKKVPSCTRSKVKKEDTRHTTFLQFQNEVKALRRLSSSGNKFCLKFYMTKDVSRFRKLIVTELCVTNLRALTLFAPFYDSDLDQVKAKTPEEKIYPIEIVHHLLFPILSAISTLHKKQMVYRDVKEDNILLTREGVPKLCDFGFVKDKKVIFTEGQEKFLFKSCDYVGTDGYVAPEISLGEDFNEKVDSWSLGCTIVSLLKGGEFSKEDLKNFEALEKNVLEHGLTAGKKDSWDAIQEVLGVCLRVDQENRLTLEDVEKFESVQKTLELWETFFNAKTRGNLTKKEVEDKLYEFNIYVESVQERLEKYEERLQSVKIIS
eukprot:augustus_masked-scaffold_27-processed-gene-1.10-mRNA-1 protein AED:0.55 eAED:0.84 QI:0/-1/0/1/-1/1/1/0/390